MAIIYYIAPFDPTDHSPDAPAEISPSDLYIASDEYRDRLKQRWNGVVFMHDSSCELHWQLPAESDAYRGLLGCLQANHQIVDFGVGSLKSIVSFILWHRAFVAMRYPLYLFDSGNRGSLLLTSQTSASEIAGFAGIID